MPVGDEERWYVALHHQPSKQSMPSAVAGPFDARTDAEALADWILTQFPSCGACAVAANPSNEGVLFADAPRFPGTTAGLQQAVATCGLDRPITPPLG